MDRQKARPMAPQQARQKALRRSPPRARRLSRSPGRRRSRRPPRPRFRRSRRQPRRPCSRPKQCPLTPRRRLRPPLLPNWMPSRRPRWRNRPGQSRWSKSPVPNPARDTNSSVDPGAVHAVSRQGGPCACHRSRPGHPVRRRRDGRFRRRDAAGRALRVGGRDRLLAEIVPRVSLTVPESSPTRPTRSRESRAAVGRRVGLCDSAAARVSWPSLFRGKACPCRNRAQPALRDRWNRGLLSGGR